MGLNLSPVWMKHAISPENNFDPLHIITEKYSTLRKYAPRMLSALQLVATPAAQPLADALVVIKDMYRKQSRKVPAAAPLRVCPLKAGARW